MGVNPAGLSLRVGPCGCVPLGVGLVPSGGVASLWGVGSPCGARRSPRALTYKKLMKNGGPIIPRSEKYHISRIIFIPCRSHKRVLYYSLRKEFVMSRNTDADRFWPALFDDDEIVDVRPIIHDLGDPLDASPSGEVVDAREYLDEREREKLRMEQYHSRLDKAAMAMNQKSVKKFIACYATTHNMIAACAQAQVSPAAVNRRKRIDPVFAEMFELARASWVDKLEAVGMERATMDIDDPRDMGPSNDMLKFMLKANDPKYNDKMKVVTENTNRNVNLDLGFSLDGAIDKDDQEQLQRIAHKVLHGR